MWGNLKEQLCKISKCYTKKDYEQVQNKFLYEGLPRAF